MFCICLMFVFFCLYLFICLFTLVFVCLHLSLSICFPACFVLLFDFYFHSLLRFSLDTEDLPEDPRVLFCFARTSSLPSTPPPLTSHAHLALLHCSCSHDPPALTLLSRLLLLLLRSSSSHTPLAITLPPPLTLLLPAPSIFLSPSPRSSRSHPPLTLISRSSSSRAPHPLALLVHSHSSHTPHAPMLRGPRRGSARVFFFCTASFLPSTPLLLLLLSHSSRASTLLLFPRSSCPHAPISLLLLPLPLLPPRSS